MLRSLTSWVFSVGKCWENAIFLAYLGLQNFIAIPLPLSFKIITFLISDLLKLLFKISLSSSHLAMLIFLLCSGRRISHAAVDLVEESW